MQLTIALPTSTQREDHSRRTFLLGGGSVLLLAACGGDDGGSAPTPTPPPSAALPPAPEPISFPPARRNLAVATQNWASQAYLPFGGATIGAGVPATAEDGTALRLFTVNLASAEASIRYAPTVSPFVAGRTYMISFYVRSAGNSEGFVWSRLVERGGEGHEPKWHTPNLRRVFTMVYALTARDLAPLSRAGLATASNPGQGMPVLLYRGEHAGGAPITLQAGGLQIEEVAPDRRCIALIGDSTQNFDSNQRDAQEALTPAKWLAGRLDMPVFNRAISGQATATMVSRWSSDMTPLAVNASWALIQGGINDVHRGQPLATIQANLRLMATRAERDGMRPVVCTATPTHFANSAGRIVRDQLNTWIRTNFPRVIDLDAALCDPANPQLMAAAYTTDGTHYTDAGNRAAGLVMADQPFWSRPTPSVYEPVA
ncbi:GDSL-type esterase/lipase family protein [Croceibacterium mercuriale]|nr:GDSL-type esterase/lipase family protein [Croceibacterium mercuriale]